MKQQNISKQYRRQGRRTRNQRKRERIKTACMVFFCLLLWLTLCSTLVVVWAEHPAEQPVDGREYMASIQADSVNYGTAVRPAIYISEEAANAEALAFYSVPLDTDLQAFIIRKCEKLNMEPSIIIAMIDQESDFNADCIGDGGASEGMMQIQKRWHQERMDKLGVTDLFNPYQNVTVGIDYLAELIDMGNGLEWALAAYNAGASGANNGIGFGYAAAVLANSEVLKGGVQGVGFQNG